ncbi:MAG: M50 family metallopeptidase [Bacteroidales bacterium]|jgi:hypothetical protein|nr:M50 family metallopeptidase [Bacteroidales bacterium]
MHEPLFFNIPLFYYFVAGSILLTRLPVIGRFFNVINTAIHEFGHVFTALILDGEVIRVELWHNSAGITATRSKNLFLSALVSFMGYPFASSAAYFGCYLLSIGYDLHLIAGLSLLFLVMLLLWIRNAFGIAWVVFFVIFNGWLIYQHSPMLMHYVALFYAAVLLGDSFMSAWVVLFLSIFRPTEAGDARNLQQITRVPAVFWAIIFVFYATWIVYKIVYKNYIYLCTGFQAEFYSTSALF